MQINFEYLQLYISSTVKISTNDNWDCFFSGLKLCFFFVFSWDFSGALNHSGWKKKKSKNKTKKKNQNHCSFYWSTFKTSSSESLICSSLSVTYFALWSYRWRLKRSNTYEQTCDALQSLHDADTLQPLSLTAESCSVNTCFRNVPAVFVAASDARSRSKSWLNCRTISILQENKKKKKTHTHTHTHTHNT